MGGAGSALTLLRRKPLTARRAGSAIALTTLIVTVAGGVLMTVVDRKDFPNVGRGLWWAVQTVTTVGYGDVTPTTVAGRLLGTVVMVTGIGFLSVVTAAVTATFIEATRERLGGGGQQSAIRELDEISRRLERIEQQLERQMEPRPPER